MIRILIFLLGVVFFAGAITLLASFDSRITGEAFGLRFDGPSGLILGAAIAAFLAAIYLTHKVKDIMAWPAKLRAREAAARRERGVAALTRGLEAVAVGDGEDAAHHARIARRHLDDVALTRLLTAQAAQLSGDQIAAQSSFSAMLEAPETEFLGLKGLYAQAMAAGDHDGAKRYAERAFRLRPNAAWAFQSVFELGLERGAWRETRDVLRQARKNNLVPADKADRARAALFTADAYAVQESDAPAALSELEAALKLEPEFAPAALLAGELYLKEGKRGKAARVIEAAFAGAAHPALIKFYDRLYKDDPAEKRADRLRKLAEKNPGADEAALLKARAATLEGGWREAIDILEPVVADGATAVAFALMAKAAAGLNGEEAAKPWLEHAAAAPRDPRPGAEGAFHLTREGWARLVREYMAFARLAPPPLEETAEGLSAEEMRLLLAPPPAVETPAAPEEPQASEGAAATETPEQTPEPESAILAKDDASPHAPQTEEVPPAGAVKHDEDDHIHNDEEAERAAAAAREVS